MQEEKKEKGVFFKTAPKPKEGGLRPPPPALALKPVFITFFSWVGWLLNPLPLLWEDVGIFPLKEPALKHLKPWLGACLSLFLLGCTHTTALPNKPGQTQDKQTGPPQSEKARQPLKPQSEEAQQLLKAAKQGDAKAQSELGLLYYHGEGVPQDFKAAAQWHTKAANQGEARAQLRLGFMYLLGSGVTHDTKMACTWFIAAKTQEAEEEVAPIAHMAYRTFCFEETNFSVDGLQTKNSDKKHSEKNTVKQLKSIGEAA